VLVDRRMTVGVLGDAQELADGDEVVVVELALDLEPSHDP
jgi:hypothetical protein